MTDSLGDILQRYQPPEAPEIEMIKQFIERHYRAAASVSLLDHSIIITVSSAALAGALRPRLHELQALCQTDKRLVLRIQ